MKFLGAFAALSMTALVLASPEPLAKRQDTTTSPTGLSTTHTSTHTDSTTTISSTSHTSTHTGSSGTGTGTSSVPKSSPLGSSTGNSTSGASTTPTKSGNAAVANIRPFHISAPILTALATTAGGVVFGAWVSL